MKFEREFELLQFLDLNAVNAQGSQGSALAAGQSNFGAANQGSYGAQGSRAAGANQNYGNKFG